MSIEDEQDQLDAFLMGEGGPEFDDLSVLAIEGREHATRELRRLARLEQEAAQVEAVYEAQKARLDAYREDRMAGIRSRRAWLENGLESFMRATAERDRILSLTLPDGKLALSKPRAKVEGAAEDVPEDLAPFLVRYNPQLDKAEAHRRLTPAFWLHPAEGAALVSFLTQAPFTPMPVGAGMLEGQVLVHAAVDVHGEWVPGITFVAPTRRTFKVTLPDTKEESGGVDPF